MLGAEGPKNIALSAEIADGWLPLFFAPKDDAFYRGCHAEGFARPGARRTADDFEVICTVPVIIHDDVDEVADFIRPFLGPYMGGMGARGEYFHFDAFARMGCEATATKVQELYLAGDEQAAHAAVPTELVEQVALVGPADTLRDDLQRWHETCITTMLVSGPPNVLRQVAELVAG